MITHLTVGERWRIISLRFDQGISPNQITRMINCPLQSVFSILRLYRKTNNVLEREGRGRLNALNDDEIRVLRQLLYRYPNHTWNRTGRLPVRSGRTFKTGRFLPVFF
ncbi:unnamed protein product [Rotaria sp. Silwood1]|nr:unnamed protein product [Rotaria sp. Silwood1]